LKTRLLILLTLLLTFSLLRAGIKEDCDQLIQSGIKAAENGDFILSFESLSSAKTIAVENNLYQEQFWILTNMGINYAEMLDYSEALDNFLEAYKIALKHLNARNEMSILNNIAGLYYLDKKFDKAQEYYGKIYEYAQETNDSILLGGSALNLSLITNQTRQLKESQRYLDIADRMFDEDSKELLKSKSFRIKTLLLKEKFDEAEQLSIEVLPNLDHESQELKISVLISLIKISIHKKEFNKAIDYVDQVMKCEPNLENKMSIYDLLSTIYQERGNYTLALNYKDSILYAADSLQKIKNSKHFENNRIKFELIRNEQELSESKLRLRTERIVFVFVIIIAIILIWMIVINAAKQKQKKKIIELKLEQEKNRKLLLEKQYKEQETSNLLEKQLLITEQEKLSREIESKNRSLTTKAIFLSNRNELIENIVNSLLDSPDISDHQGVSKYIHQLKEELKSNSEQDNFLSHFENVNSEFIHALREKHPNLTANEVRFLSYIYINLSSKEISSLLNITPEYCKKKKQQIAKKMDLESTSKLYEYLSNL